MLKLVKPGAWVVVEFGHNDGGGLGSRDNGRADCFGAGNETCDTTYNGASETVQTYPTYLKQAGAAFLAAGAKLVISAPTPNNVWESGSYSWGPDRFAYYSWLVSSSSPPVSALSLPLVRTTCPDHPGSLPNSSAAPRQARTLCRTARTRHRP